jgi:uncharacterized protein
MRVNIDEIKEAGLRRQWSVNREALDEIIGGDPAGYRAREALEVEGSFRKVERRVLFHARAAARLTVPCGRCLGSVEIEVPVEFSMTYVPEEGVGPRHEADDADRPGARTGGSFGSDDVNEEGYSGKTIDVDPVVREQVLLALPGYPVCDEACKGLCLVCGANLNERECGCERRSPDPRWSGLEKLKQKSKEE